MASEIQSAQERQTATKDDLRKHYRLRSNRTIELWMKRGWIPYQKIGRTVRFDLDAVTAAMQRRFGRNTS